MADLLKRSLDTTSPPPADDDEGAFAARYARLSPVVRRALAKFGVLDADVPDLTHEVFLIAETKPGGLAGIQHPEAWLTEVSRRLAAAYRRRSGHRFEILTGQVERAADAGQVADDPPAVTSWLEEESVRVALAALDEESRDLLALHEVGDLPVVDLAELTGHDRKTITKRLDIARRRLRALLVRDGGPPVNSRGAEWSSASWADGKIETAPLPETLEILAVTPYVKVGLVGNVAVTVWPSVAAPEAFDTLMDFAPQVAARCGGQFAYLGLVEGSVRPPPFPARQKIVQVLETFGKNTLAYAGVLMGGAAWVARPIMNGLAVLARPRFPMMFFGGVEPARAWLSRHGARGPSGPLTAESFLRNVERLRATRT